MSRNRTEASWTHERATVKGRRRDKWWVLLALIVALVVVVTLTWNRMMGVGDVTFELRHCAQPLAKDSSWEEVQAAACDPAPIEGTTLNVLLGLDPQEPVSTTETTWTFENIAVNSPENGLAVRTDEPVQSVVLAEPESQQIRRALTSDASDQRWNANIGGRGPTSYWVLVTP